MSSRWSVTARCALVVLALSAAVPALAIPAFARKYATSCLTCHTVYPKLTPFGEAFRMNGYRFPGVDSDLIKADQIALGQEVNKKTFPATVWPAFIPAAVPISIGANGQAFITPSKNTSAGVANNGTLFTMQQAASEGHIWAGAALDDTITTWAEVTFADDGTVDVEHAQLLFNDLVGPKHAVNLIVGHGFPNVTQYGPHSSYLSDQMLTVAPVTAIYQGDPNPWTLVDNYTGAELNGVIEGRFDYALGLNAGKTNRISATDNFYGRVGVKFGGMRLDGEGSTGAADAVHPWAEDALGLYAFGYQANSRIDTTTTTLSVPTDTANVFGGGARGQLGSTELNVGYYTESHKHGMNDGSKVTANVAFGELSYVLYPWLVPAIRIENVSLKPSGGSSVSDLHIQPGVAILIRPNIRLVATFDIESTNGYPTLADGTTLVATGWQGVGSSGWGPFQATPPANGKTKLTEFQSVGLFLAWAM
jgi:hypothetical protein